MSELILPVQQPLTMARTASGTSRTNSLPSAATAGNLIVALFWNASGDTNINTVTGLCSTWTYVVSGVWGLAYGIADGGGTTVTLHATSARTMALMLYEFTPAQAIGSITGHVNTAGSAPPPEFTTDTITSAQTVLDMWALIGNTTAPTTYDDNLSGLQWARLTQANDNTDVIQCGGAYPTASAAGAPSYRPLDPTGSVTGSALWQLVISGSVPRGWVVGAIGWGGVPGGPAYPLYVNTASNTSNGSSISVPIPTGTQAGDLLLMFLNTLNANTVPTTPTGWTRLGTVPASSALVVYSKIAVAGEPSASVSLSGSTHTAARTVTYRGTGISVQSIAYNTVGSTSSLSLPAGSTTGDVMLVAGYAKADGSNFNSSPSGGRVFSSGSAFVTSPTLDMTLADERLTGSAALPSRTITTSGTTTQLTAAAVVLTV